MSNPEPEAHELTELHKKALREAQERREEVMRLRVKLNQALSSALHEIQEGWMSLDCLSGDYASDLLYMDQNSEDIRAFLDDARLAVRAAHALLPTDAEGQVKGK